MALNATYRLQFRRRRQGKTNYKKRLALVKSNLPRAVVRKTNKYIIFQIIEFGLKGDKTIIHVNSKKLEKFGWKASKKNLPAAYLTGLLAAIEAKKKGVKKTIFDIGFHTPVHGSVCFSALKGALDAGLSIQFDEKALPAMERIKGQHIEDYSKKLGEKELSERFSHYAKEKIDVKQLSKLFEKVKESILKQGGK